MTCSGCVAGAEFVRDPGYTGVNPVIDPIDFYPTLGTQPDGTCTGTPCHQTNPCTPIGGIGFANCFPGPVEINYRTWPAGNFDGHETIPSGTEWLIPMNGAVSVECGGKFLMAEVRDVGGDAPAHLGVINFTCSTCGTSGQPPG